MNSFKINEKTLLEKRNRILSYKIFFLLIILPALLFINSGCGNSDYSTNSNTIKNPGSDEVFIQGMSFSPGNKTISAGTTLKWTNQDSYAHTVTSGVPGSPSGLFDSESLGSNGTFSFKFNTVGTYKYYCKIHSSMTGTITVK